MKIGLIDVDSHNFPNLPLMKISAYHKAKGDQVEWCNLFEHYDRVYMSRVFDDMYTEDFNTVINADEIIKGGTGYDLKNKLPDEIEHIYPDYSLYPELTKGTAFGFLTRGCPNNCPFCIVSKKEGLRSYKVADLSEFWKGQKNIELLDPNILACRQHKELLHQLIESKANVNFNQGLDARFINEKKIVEGLKLYKEATKIDRRKAVVYILTNYNTTYEEDIYRINKCIELGYNPDVRIYNKPTAPKITRDLQRWCNNRFVFESTNRNFENYKRKG